LPTEECASGMCGCPGGGSICNGACALLQSDPMNCGSCGVTCPPTQSCGAGNCVDLYVFSGVQQNVPIASLAGWTQCFLGGYSASASLAQIQTDCAGSKLLLGCRLAGDTTLAVAAQGPTTDVLFDTGSSQTPHDANGVGWYFNSSYSWGFAPQGS